MIQNLDEIAHRNTEINNIRHEIVQRPELWQEMGFESTRILCQVFKAFGQFPG